MQLDELLDDLAKAKDIEAAAKLDVDDYRHHEQRWARERMKAEQLLAEAKDRTEQVRAEFIRVAEAQTDSSFTKEPPDE